MIKVLSPSVGFVRLAFDLRGSTIRLPTMKVIQR
jgi:hypothetical protein